MELGAFSISLALNDLEASRKFYEKFGFTVFAGDPSQNWLILKNGNQCHWPFSRDVRQEHPHVQPWVGQ
jgi:hypothetical protein